MNLQAIIIANLVGFNLILFLRISRYISQTKADTEEKAFNVMMYLVMIACIVEPVTFFVDGKPGALSYWINVLGNTYLYYANTTGTFLWFMFMDLSMFHDRSRMKKIYYKLAVPAGLLIASLIGNIWGKYYFYVDDQNAYHRLPAVYIFYFYLILCAFYTLWLYYSYKSRHGETAFFPVYMYLAPILVTSILQMLIYGISLAWLGSALGIVAVSMTLQQQKAYIDELTGLYNRLFLNHILYKMMRNNADFFGIMMDLNDFKAINDNYGHSSGDSALVDAASVFRKSLNNDSLAFRYAGDEFIIIVKTSKLDDVLQIEKSIQENIYDFNKNSDHPYVLSVAFGHDRFDKEKDNEDSFLNKIDHAMYQAKKAYHEQGR